MATEQIGTAVSWTDEIIQTASGNKGIATTLNVQKVEERAETKNEGGNLVGIQPYNEHATGDAEVTVLAGDDFASIEGALKSVFEGKATAAPFSLPSGGSTLVTDVQLKFAAASALTYSCKLEYWPYAKASE